MDEFQHPLFFEARDVTDREREKIRRHFLKKRDSGGGECGAVEKIGGNIYKISFKEKEDQERVLQRKFHTISLPSGELHLTVSRTDSPQNPDQPSTSQSFQTRKQANKKSFKKIFKLDIYLLYYLRGNLRANQILRKQLSCIDCTVDFNLEEEEAVVRGDINKGSGDAFGSAAENWEIQVDRVFIGLIERYQSYHVVDPKSARILLQDLSFVTDDLKVYIEGGYAVVVGEVEAVNERIAILEKSVPTRKELPIVEKQFKLVEEEFNRHMTAHCPEVKICRGNATIILEGLDKDVQQASIKLDELIKKIKEKRVKISTPLLTFIKSSNAISKYQARFQQNLRNLVSLEVGSDLVLSSLSPDALDEAEAALHRDLIVANVELQGAAAVPPDLDRVKEIMIKAKNEANCRELRVDVSFIPGPSGTTKVQLVGYRENVNKLKEVLHEYQINQVGTQEVLNLPLPELVDSFDKVLKMIGMKQTNVTLKASHFPYPCVLVSGPRCLVQETQRNLNATLASLTSDKLVLDGPGAQLYFQAEGKVSKELIESSCHVLIREQQQHQQKQPVFSVSPGALCTTSTSNQSVFLFLGLSRKDVDDAMTKLKELYQAQCSTQTFKKEELGILTSDDMKDLNQLVETKGLYLQMAQSGQGSLTVSGLKDGVNQVMQMINASLHGSLRREVRVRKGKDLYTRVAWCILGHNSNWERLPKTANHKLENKDVAGGIEDAQGIKWSVDLQRLEAKTQMRLLGHTTKLKRLENLPDFTFPLYWDNMGNDENLKAFVLQPSSPEYRTVKEAFKRTVSKTVMKIERLQNVHLRHVYEVQKKHISDKNKQEGGAGEKLLYHGTTKDNCDSIMKTGFNRSFAGQNATAYGLGTYFAVNASYSANYSRPAFDGTQVMFVARVLTGLYAQGQSNMKVPPPRNGLQSNDRYDSVVDNMSNPNMYVVFHDNQAYPDYLITFK
ncbi:Poly [ADP-ribose] polymerase 14 [Larimichthys crocea]|uniref:Poly [ADP-ribose] polymerase n=1 Tax=Larimichthys crocea TaxID=215358 RepID=A0A6G0HIW8_LARCR|nr:Poly [ADP-ribose] polymerase 14 [Larimichthys crocea]